MIVLYGIYSVTGPFRDPKHDALFQNRNLHGLKRLYLAYIGNDSAGADSGCHDYLQTVCRCGESSGAQCWRQGVEAFHKCKLCGPLAHYRCYV